MIGVIEMRHRYAIEIFYSDKDEGFVTVAPELAGCSAFGETEEEALAEVKVAIGLWLDTAREEGREFGNRAAGSTCGKGRRQGADGVISTPCANRHSPEHNTPRTFFANRVKNCLY
jgi:predicted RNase H-like HicB family nuclease